MFKRLSDVDQEGFESWSDTSKWEHRPNIKNAQKRKGIPKHPFYHSDAWLKLRQEVLIHYGRKCMKCKTTTKILQVDHIKPRHYHPELELDFNNMQVLCIDCNGDKGIKEADYRKAA